MSELSVLLQEKFVQGIIETLMVPCLVHSVSAVSPGLETSAMLSARLLVLQGSGLSQAFHFDGDPFLLPFVSIESILKCKSVNFADRGMLCCYIWGLFLKDFITFLFSKDLIAPEYNFKLHLKRTILIL